MTQAEIETQLEQALTDPASASSDGQSVTSRSAADQIALIQFLSAAAARSNRRRGILYSKMINPGALSDASLAGSRAFDGGPLL